MEVRSGNTVNTTEANHSVLPSPSFSSQTIAPFHCFLYNHRRLDAAEGGLIWGFEKRQVGQSYPSRLLYDLPSVADQREEEDTPHVMFRVLVGAVIAAYGVRHTVTEIIVFS
jgi:hypothetical protein